MTEEVLVTPDDAVAMAMKYFVEGNAKEAESILRTVIEADPGHAVAMHRLGALLADRGEYFEALYRLDESIRMSRKSPIAHSNRAMVLGELGHYDRAMVDIEIALRLQPDNAVTWNNKGNTLIFLDRCEEAASALRRALSIDPKHLLSWYNLGVALLRLGNTEEGMKALEGALELQPGYPDATFNLSMAQLSLGDYANGWKNYEARWDTGEYVSYKAAFPQPLWRGEDLTEKSIVVYGDQGYGDSIMFSRYLPMIVATGAKVYCNAHVGLRELFAGTFDGVEFLNPGDPMPAVDYRCAFPSAPGAFGTTLDTIPTPWPFRLPEGASKKWRDVMSEDFKVGVCWSGNWKHVNDKFRSIPFRDFSRLLDAPGVKFYNLQYEVREEDRAAFASFPGLARLDLRSWVDTCAAIGELDLVISVDTAVAHMAASTCVPTWILLPTPRTDWRWLKERRDSPWYPTAKLYRQDYQGDWRGVFNLVDRDLSRLTAQRAAA